MQRKLFSLVVCTLTLNASGCLPAHAAPPAQDVGKNVGNTIEKAGDNLDKSMKSFSNDVRKQISAAAASTNSKTKASDKKDEKSKSPTGPYTVQKAEKDLSQVGKNLDSSMKTVSENVRKGLAQKPAGAKK